MCHIYQHQDPWASKKSNTLGSFLGGFGFLDCVCVCVFKLGVFSSTLAVSGES